MTRWGDIKCPRCAELEAKLAQQDDLVQESSATYPLNRGETHMADNGLQFGAFVRREREAKEIGLREMAKKIGVSPTYLSRVERDEFTPPTEDKVRAIAQIIECDIDELLAMSGRMPSDLADIIKRNPVEVSALLRTTSGMTRDQIARLAEGAKVAQRCADLADTNGDYLLICDVVAAIREGGK